MPRFSAAVTVSTIEADELRRTASLPVLVIPTGVDTQKIRPAPEPGGPPQLLFAGTLGYPPNAQGVTWFVERAWPEVRRKLPDARLDIAGRDPPPDVVALGGRDGITVIGPVPEMAPYFARAHAVVVPILTGAGMRVKIVDAMANGRAVVSTSLGWEGLPHVQPDRHLLVADQPPEFAAATVRLLREPALRGTLATAARELAERHYDWRGLGDMQELALRDAIEDRTNAANPRSPAPRTP
jgi:glycosyltransferase involved in cell wall biosynthesis